MRHYTHFPEGAEEDEKSLTSWEKAPKLTDLKADYTAAYSEHTLHTSKVRKWLDNLNITGSAKRKKCANSSSVQPMLIRKQAEWRYAALSEPFLSNNNIFDVKPVTFEDKAAAEQNSLVLNNQFNTAINKVSFIDRYVRTAVDEGTAIIRVAWESREEVVEKEYPIFSFQQAYDPAVVEGYMQQLQDEVFTTQNPEEAEAYQQALIMTQQNGVPIEAVPSGVATRQVSKLVVNRPTLDICEYDRVTIDPTCRGNLDDASFIIYRYDSSIAELKKTGKFKNLDAVVPGESPLGAADEDVEVTSFKFNDEPRKKVTVYEYWGYWDIHGTGTVEPIVASWIGNTLIQLEENPYPDGKLPFVLVHYLPVRNSIYGEPDGALLKDNQDIIGAVTRGMIDIMGKSANGQVGSRKDALDLPNQRKFDKGLDYQFNPDINPRDAFFLHTFAEIPRSAEFMLNQQNAEAESLTGVKAFTSGISGTALGDTATGIRSALDATSKRELGILRRLAEGLKEAGRKVIAMNGEFLSKVEVIRVTNSEFVEVHRDDLAGNIDLFLSISTPEADNDKAEQLAFMVQTAGTNADPAEIRMVRAEIAKLRKMPDLAEQILNFQPQPDPLEVERQQLEIELLKAQIANEYAKAHENNANGDLDEAKVLTEQAKARDFHSTADQKDLDYVEQESGVHSERAKDENRAKAFDKTQGDLALASNKAIADQQLQLSKPTTSN